MAKRETYQAYYVDVPIIEVRRYFVRGATSKEDAMDRVMNDEEGIDKTEIRVLSRTMQADQHWNAETSNDVERLDQVTYELR